MAPGLYRFGPFTLDVPTRRLLRGAEPVALTPKAFDGLVVLVESRGRAQRKTELIARLWPDRVVEEANLTQTVFTLRKALGDDDEPHRYIGTVPRYGYRFVAQVAESEEPSTPPAAPAAGRWGPLRTPAVLILVSLGTLAAGWLSSLQRASAPRLVAVLPFEDTSTEGGWQYVADGVTEGLINRVARLRGLRVLARTTVFRYQGRLRESQRVGRELGVEQLVTGRIAVRDGKVDVQAELLQVSSGAQLWGRRLSAGFGGLERVERELVGELATQLVASQSVEARTAVPPRVDAEAQRLYLEARYFWNKRTAEGLHKSLALFDAALQRQPDYAQAFSGIADSYSLLPEYAGVSPREAYPAAREAARRALALDESLAEAHSSLAFVRFWWQRERKAAETGFLRAIELNPSYATAHHWYGNSLLAEGRAEDAIVQIRAARELDPLSLIIVTELGAAHYYARQYDEAVRLLRHALELDPAFALARFWLGRSLLFSGQVQEALAEYDRADALMGASSPMLAERGYALARSGRVVEARRQLEAFASQPAMPAYALNRAILHVGLGERDAAFAWLECARVEREIDLGYVGLDPIFEPLRPDPRFAALQLKLREPRRE